MSKHPHNKNSQQHRNNQKLKSQIRLLLNRQHPRKPLRSKRRELVNNSNKCRAWELVDKKSTSLLTLTRKATAIQMKINPSKTVAVEMRAAVFSETTMEP
jgi:hypothetical protein